MSATSTEPAEAGEPVVPRALDPLEHYVVESLRAGLTREEVRRTLDLRIMTVIGDKIMMQAPTEQVQAALSRYVDCVLLLDRTHLVEATA